MSYKKRLIIFFSVMGALAIILVTLYIIEARANLKEFSTDGLIPEKIEKDFKSNVQDKIEFQK